ncbi:MAG TPA: YfhO family protein [Conexibacter sp.]|nr:YfhO family protein [Conexibacter sp.]
MRAHEHRAAAGLFALFVLVYLWPVLAGGDVLSPASVLWGLTPWRAPLPAGLARFSNELLSDVPMAYYPWDVLARSMLHSGTFPAWNPYAFGGTPFFANLSVAWLGPFSMPLWLLSLNYGIGVSAALKLWAAAFGTYLLVRELRLGFWAGLVAGVSFALCAFDVAWLTHQALVAVAALLPWLVWLTERIVRRGGRVEGVVLAVVVAAALAGGHPGTEVHVLAATALYALVRSATIAGTPPRERLWRLATVGGGIVAGALLMAVILVPGERATLDTVGEAARRNGGQGLLRGATLPLKSLLAAAFPDWWGRPSEVLFPNPPPSIGPGNYNERAFYAGTVALVLAFVALASRGAWRRKAPFAALAALGLAMALKAPLIWTFVVHLPVFDRVQNQRMLLWFAFAIAVLCAFGVQAVLDAPREQRRAWAAIGAAVAGGLVALAAIHRAPGDVGGAFHHLIDRFAGATPGALASASAIRWLAFVALVALALLLVRARPERRWLGGGMLALAAACDMLLFAHAYQPMGPASIVFPPRTPAVAFLRQHAAEGRITGVEQALLTDWPTVYGLRDVRGYEPPQPSRRFYALWSAVNPGQLVWTPFETGDLSPRTLRVLGLLGVRYVVAEPKAAPPPGGELSYAYRGGDAAVLRNALAAPRAFVADRVELAAGEPREIATVTSPRFDPRRDAVARRDELAVAPPPSSVPGTVRVMRDANASVTLRALLPHRALVVLDDAWAKGWSVAVDGRPARALQADVVMRGVMVPAGTHEIVWRYRVPGLRLGLLMSVAGLLALLAWSGVLIRARRS